MTLNLIKKFFLDGFMLKKETKSRCYPAETIMDANYADDI